MLKLKLQYFGHDVKNQLTEKDPDAGKDQRQKKKWVTEDEIDSITDSIDMNLSKVWEIVEDITTCHATVQGFAKSQTQLSD